MGSGSEGCVGLHSRAVPSRHKVSRTLKLSAPAATCAVDTRGAERPISAVGVTDPSRVYSSCYWGGAKQAPALLVVSTRETAAHVDDGGS